MEPSSQNTAPAITAAALKAVSQGNDPILLILPSDHQITNDKIFLDSIEEAKQATIEGSIVTFGIKPSNPATGFGYIKSKSSFNTNFSGPIKLKVL